MKKISLILSAMFLSIGLVGCQQINEEVNDNNSNTIQSNEKVNNSNTIQSTFKETNKNYDVEGLVVETDIQSKRVLLNLTKKAQENGEQMWVEVGNNTKITNENGEILSLEKIKTGVNLKINITNICAEPSIPICSAEEIVIENKAPNKNYDIAGVVSEVNNENNRVLLDLTKEEKMRITVESNTKITNENGEILSFEKLKIGVNLKANVADICAEPRIPICSAEEIVIE